MIKRLLRSRWVWLGAALALRVGFALKLGGSRYYQVDEHGFVGAAQALAASGTFGPHALAPLVPAFFALFFRFLGPGFLGPRLAGALLGLLTVWVIGRMAEDLSGSSAAGSLALALSAVYPFFIYYDGMLLSETLYLLLITSGLWLLARGLGRARPFWGEMAAAGFLLGLSALARPEAEFAVLAVWLSAAAFVRARRRGSWTALACAILCWALPIFGWCARNHARAGTWKLDDHGGLTMLHGTLLFDLNEIDTGVAMQALERMPFYREAQKLPEPEKDSLFMGRALAFMRQNPGQTLAQWGLKFVNFWRFYPRSGKKFIENRFSRPDLGFGHGLLVAASLLFEPWLILGGLWGLALLLRRRPQLWVLAVFLLATMGIHMASVSQMRYRLPVMPILMLGFCALAAGRLGLDA